MHQRAVGTLVVVNNKDQVVGIVTDRDLALRVIAKATCPGRKQVFRQFEARRMMLDTIAAHDDSQRGEPLLKPVMKNGHYLAPKEPLSKTRKRVVR
jgi:CBS domain-containing protein